MMDAMNSLLGPASMDAHLSFDFHGFRRKDAKDHLTKLFYQAQERKVSSLTLITGRGNHVNSNGTRAVLFHSVPKWLERPEFKDRIQAIKRDMGAYEITLKSEEKDQKHQELREKCKSVSQMIFPPAYVEHIKKKAAEGEPSFQYILGGLLLEGHITDPDVAQGIALIENAAQAGDQFAQMQLGFLYALGKGVPKNYDKSRQWHLKATENDAQTDSLIALGQYYWVGQGVKRNDKLAIDYLTRAARKGDPVAAHNLGKIYIDGSDEIPADGSLAIRFLEQGARGNILDAKVHLAKVYFFGWANVPVDTVKARQYFQQAAEENDASAEYYLGRIFSEGLGVDIDSRKAFEWFKRSAEHGDRDAKKSVACMIFKGEGVQADPKEGVRLLKELADAGHYQSAAVLGFMFFNGVDQDVLKVNLNEGLKYLLQAEEKHEYVEIELFLGKMYLNPKSLLHNPTEGLKWLNKALAKNCAEAHCLMGCYTFETAGEQDYPKAFEHIKKAAELNDPNAMHLIALNYLSGALIPRDVALGNQWMQKAAAAQHPEAAFSVAIEKMKSQNPDDREQAVAIFTKLATSFAPAQTALGYCYREGRGVTKNAQQADMWFAKAAQNNDPQALLVIGAEAEKKGRFQEAFQRYLQAAPESAPAALRLARCYIEGKGTPKNAREAQRWLSPLAENHNHDAEYWMGVLYSDRQSKLFNLSKAIGLLEKALEGECIQAGVRLAELSQSQRGKNGKNSCLQVLLKLAESGNQQAQKSLIELAMSDASIVRSKRWIEKARQTADIPFEYILGGLFLVHGMMEEAVDYFVHVVKRSSTTAEEYEAQALACETLAEAFQRQNHVVIHYKLKALEFYKKLPLNTEREAKLGRLHYEVGNDITIAKTFLENAAKQGHLQAKKDLAWINRELEKNPPAQHAPPLTPPATPLPQPVVNKPQDFCYTARCTIA